MEPIGKRVTVSMITMNEEGSIATVIQSIQKIIPDEKTVYRRQDLPKVYILNGALDVANIDWLLINKTFLTDETVGFVMPQERSLDIDSEFDLQIALLSINARKAT